MPNQSDSQSHQNGKNQSGSKPLAVVTGASSGIGFELAKIFAKNGFDLIVVSGSAKITLAAKEFEECGAKVDAVEADLATYGGVDALNARIQAAGRPIDAIALNAGVGVSGEFVETDLKREINLLQLNVVSVVHLTKHVLPAMVKRGAGRILFTSSLAAEMPGPYYAVYAASKAFVQSFAEAIRAEVKDSGVTVTALQPGATDTGFFERADMQDTKAGVSSKDDAAKVAQQGFDALMAGQDHVVAGSVMNKVQAVVGKILPETVGAKMQGQQVKPGSASH